MRVAKLLKSLALELQWQLSQSQVKSNQVKISSKDQCKKLSQSQELYIKVKSSQVNYQLLRTKDSIGK